MHLDNSKQFSGRLTTGKAAQSHAVIVRLKDRGIEIDAGLSLPDEPSLHSWYYRDLTSSVPVSGKCEEVLISHAKQIGATLFVDDPVFAQTLAQLAPQISAKSWRLVGLKPAGGISATIAACMALIYVTGYSPAKTIAKVMPQKARTQLGISVVRSMSRRRKVCHGPAGQRALNKMMKKLSEAAGLAQPFKVTVIQWPMVNAFAAPGGKLVLTSGLIRRASSADMVAGVMAHEMGHGIELHPEAGLVRALGMSAASEFFFTGSSSALKNIGFLLATLSYTRAAETQADEHAERILQKAGISAKPLAKFFDQLSKNAKPSRIGKVMSKYRFLSTHPPSPERAKRFAAATSHKVAPALSAADWRALRGICGRPRKRLSKAERLAATQKSFADAVKRYSKILRADPSNINALKRRAVTYKRLKRYDKALADLSRLTTLQPDVAMHQFRRARIFTILKQIDKALGAYRRAIALAPKNSKLYHFRAQLLIKQEKWDEAIWDLNSAIAIRPKRTEYYIARARALRAKGDFPAALADIAAVLKIAPKSSVAYLQRGKIRVAMHQDEDAIADFSKAISIASRYTITGVLTARGRAFERVGDHDAAITDYQRLLGVKAYSIEAKADHKHARGRLKILRARKAAPQ